MNTRIYLSVLLLPTLFFSCGKKNNSDSRQSFAYPNSYHLSRNDVVTPFEAPIKLKDGFNSMVQTIHEPCINAEVTYPSKIISTSFKTLENLSFKQLLSEIKAETAISVPIKGVDFSTATQFAKQAASNSLSWTLTHIVEINPGEIKLSDKEAPKLVPELYKYFTEDRKLNDYYEFIQKCGNEVVISQKLSAKLLITVKLDFDSHKDKNQFSQKMGTSIPNIFGSDGILSTGKNGVLNFGVNSDYLNSEERKRTHLSIHAVQFGGYPLKLLEIMKYNSVCKIEQLDKCNDIFTGLKKYASENFKTQFDESSKNSWIVESSYTVPYNQLKIVDSNGSIIDFSIIDEKIKNLDHIKIMNEIGLAFKKESYNKIQALSYSNIEHLNVSDKKEYEDIINNAQTNMNYLEEFSKLTHDLILMDRKSIKEKLEEFLLKYDTKILSKDPTGVLLAKGISQTVPYKNSFILSKFQKKKRSSEDIASFQIFFNNNENENFKSFQFLFKTKDGTPLNEGYIDVFCNKPSDIDTLLFKNVSSEDTFLLSSFEALQKNGCLPSYGFYIGNPKEFKRSKKTEYFIVEIIGKK